MEKHVLILLLIAFIVAVQCHPFSIILEGGIKSNATVVAEGKAGAETGWNWGPTVEGKARGEVGASWLKNAYGKIGYVDSKGVPHGIAVSIGSVMNGKGTAEANAKAGTNLINSKLDKNASAGIDGGYKAGVDVHFLKDTDILEVEGVNKQTIKTPDEKDPNVGQPSGELNQVDRDSKKVKGEENQDGFVKRVWKKITGK